MEVVHKQHDVTEDVQQATAVPNVVNQDTDQNTTLSTAQAAGPRKYPCDICPFRAKSAQLLDMHKVCHKYQPGNRFKCKYCPYFVSVMRHLYQHMRLHPEHKEKSNSFDPSLRIGDDDSVPVANDNFAFSTKGGKQTCNKCPFICKSRNGIIYHMQFHKHRPNSTFKCPDCPYWVEHQHQLNHHQRVHSPAYNAKVNDGSTTASTSNHTSVPMGSPAKSDILDYCDSIEMATLKQQIINSKIRSCALTPGKFTPYENTEDREGMMDIDSNDTKYSMRGFVVDDNGQILKTGSLLKVHVCSQCPYTNVKIAELKLHEAMHDKIIPKVKEEKEAVEGGEENPTEKEEEEKVFSCEFCSYNSLKKKLLAQHINVHSQQYEPGRDNIVDFYDQETFSDTEDAIPLIDDTDDDPEIQLKRPAEMMPVEPEAIIKRPKVAQGPRLEAGQAPAHYYVKYDEENGEHILERVTVQKLNCDRCPYATLTRIFFERHVLLHGSRQRFTCEFCDYSVPNFKLLLQHRKLHMMPNPNLLSMQSLSNLAKLPEISADIAVAANFPVNKDDPISTEGAHDHLALFENTEDFAEPKQLYRCERCPFTSTRKENLLSHLKYHLIRNSLKCSFCDYSTSKQDVLNLHMKVHFVSETQFESVDKIDPTLIENSDMVSDNGGKVNAQQANSVVGSSGQQNMPNDLMTDSTEVSDKDKSQIFDYTTFLAERQDDNNNGEGVKTEMGQDEMVVEGSSCICQYCDRSFISVAKRQKHEKQHLVGQMC